MLGTCGRWQPPPRCGEPATTGPREGTLGPCPETLEAAGEVLLPETRRRADANRNGPFESSGPVCSAAAAPPRPLLLLAFCTLLMRRGAAALLFPPPLLPLLQPRRTRTVPRSGGRQAKPREAAEGARSPACPHSQAEHSPCRRATRSPCSALHGSELGVDADVPLVLLPQLLTVASARPWVPAPAQAARGFSSALSPLSRGAGCRARGADDAAASAGPGSAPAEPRTSIAARAAKGTAR